jgi:hypothetical protein
MLQQGQPTPRKPGRMTAVMRAVAPAGGPKILRIGVVEGGKIVDERLVKERTTITVGPTEKATFVVASARVPAGFKLFELVEGEYYLNFHDGMSGRVALETGVSDLDALVAQARRGARARRVRLGDAARGKITIGETTFLFQFVPAPPAQARPQLPLAVQKGIAGDVDWLTAIIASFSFLAHFFLVALVYSDWMDPLANDEVTVGAIVDSVRSLPAPPAAEQPEAREEVEVAVSDARPPVRSSAARREGGATVSERRGTEGRAGADRRAAELGSELAAIDMETLGVIDPRGVATEGVLGNANLPAVMLDEQARSERGTSPGDPGKLKLGEGGAREVKPGERGPRLGDIGNDRSSDGPAEEAGKQQAVEGPKTSVGTSAQPVGGDDIPGAGGVVARLRGRLRACYLQGLAQNPDLAGSVTLVARIGPNGEVLGVSGGGGPLAAIVPCLKSVIAGAKFAPPKSGAGAVQISLNFVKQG